LIQGAAKLSGLAFSGQFFCEDLAGGIVLHPQSGEIGAATFQPVVRGAVQLYQFPFPPGAPTTLAMVGRATFTGRTDAGGAQQTAQGLTAERETFLLSQFLVEVMIVEAGITTPRQLQDAVTGMRGQTAWARPATVGVCQSRCAALPIASFQPFHMPSR